MRSKQQERVQRTPAEPSTRAALSVEDTAYALAVGRTTIFQMIKDGQLRVVKVGRRTIVPIAEIHRLLELSLRVPGEAGK